MSKSFTIYILSAVARYWRGVASRLASAITAVETTPPAVAVLSEGHRSGYAFGKRFSTGATVALGCGLGGGR